MDKIAALLRNRFPALYAWLVGIKLSIKRSFTPHRVYVTDSLGGSFKDYFLSENMPARIADLEKGLDEESLNTVRVILERLRHYPDERYKRTVSRHAPVIGGSLPVETERTRRVIDQNLRKIAQRVSFPLKQMEESVFHFLHGITELPESVRAYLENKDFIDAGAYVGDSAIALMECHPRKVYSIEMSLRSIEKYRTNMKRAGIPESLYEIVHAGISADPQTGTIRLPDTGSAGFSLLRNKGKYDPVEIPQITLDQLVSSRDIQPGFIKVDIEGYALELIKGAKDTLTQFRPVLSIAIYHNPYEFFEAKPLLEKWLPNYRFMVRKFCTGIKNNLNHSEVVLLAFPAELA